MTKLAKQQKCLIQRNGVQIWLDHEKAEKLQAILQNINEHKFIDFDGRTINTADCTGVYLPEDIENMTNRKNGRWMCNGGNWHHRSEGGCSCASIEQKAAMQKSQAKINACKMCNYHGYKEEPTTQLYGNRIMVLCNHGKRKR